jgi:hypothetical protein
VSGRSRHGALSRDFRRLLDDNARTPHQDYPALFPNNLTKPLAKRGTPRPGPPNWKGLEVLTGLWSGKPFSYDGTQYRVKDAHFAPPAQQPRIPIWVAGAWPNNPPFRRAARWDGVFPISQAPLTKHLTPAEIRDVQAYIKEYRTSGTPFEVVYGGETSGSNGAEDAALVAPYVEAGLTWWLESPGQRAPAEMRERIRQGPPRV